jgi:hypothetical protein
MKQIPRHTDPIPARWKVDREDWLYRKSRAGDQEKVSKCSRAFLENGKTYVSEVWEAKLVDGA